MQRNGTHNNQHYHKKTFNINGSTVSYTDTSGQFLTKDLKTLHTAANVTNDPVCAFFFNGGFGPGTEIAFVDSAKFAKEIVEFEKILHEEHPELMTTPKTVAEPDKGSSVSGWQVFNNCNIDFRGNAMRTPNPTTMTSTKWVAESSKNPTTSSESVNNTLVNRGDNAVTREIYPGKNGFIVYDNTEIRFEEDGDAELTSTTKMKEVE